MGNYVDVDEFWERYKFHAEMKAEEEFNKIIRELKTYDETELNNGRFEDGDLVLNKGEYAEELIVIKKNNVCGDYSKIHLLFSDGSSTIAEAKHYVRTGKSVKDKLQEILKFKG